MMRFVILFTVLATLLAANSARADWPGRGLLWRVVQGCLLNHKITGAAFPCLAVDTSRGIASGYAVLRAPRDAAHVIVTPAIRTIGIEAVQLRGAAAPDYFHDAWAARHFVADGLAPSPRRDDLAMAVNSRLGRSQDQLHIHVACLRPKLKLALAVAPLRTNPAWTQLKLPSFAYPYWAHFENSADLAGVNVVDLVAAGLKIPRRRMDGVTIVVVGVEPTGFVILARTRIPHGFDAPHGEHMLDSDCSAFRRAER